MPTIDDQLHLEDALLTQGADKYKYDARKQAEAALSVSPQGAKLLRALIQPMSWRIDELKTKVRGKYAKFVPLIKHADSTVLAYVATKSLLDAVLLDKSYTFICSVVGKSVEDEIRFSEFRKTNRRYYTSIRKDLRDKNSRSYRHAKNVLSVVSQRKGFTWEDWTTEQRVSIGSLMVQSFMECVDFIEMYKTFSGKKSIYKLRPTAEGVKWMDDFVEHNAVLHPVKNPCIIIPDDWVSITDGGFYSDQLRSTHPFITDMHKDAVEFIQQHDLSAYFTTANALQRTAWCVNKPVLDVLDGLWRGGNTTVLPRRVPIEHTKFHDDRHFKDMDPATQEEFKQWKAEKVAMYTEETKRLSRAYLVSRVIAMAKQYSEYDEFFFVYQTDFRGRFYPVTSSLSPQGADFNRALLRFKEARPLGDKGFHWLQVHGANCYGVDKVSYEGRVQWVKDHHDIIVASGQAPLDDPSFWMGADKPFQFLAFCIEYSNAYTDPTGYMSTLPVGMDGSCNGLQHYSALLSDPVGAHATNLCDTDRPQDIYAIVADLAATKVSTATTDPVLLEFLASGGMNRKITKRAVMTLPYGCTQYSCRRFIEEALEKYHPTVLDGDKNPRLAILSQCVWDSICETVTSASTAMAWLQELAGKLADANLPVWWVNPAGFPVYFVSYTRNMGQVTTAVNGERVRLAVYEDTRNVNKRKQMSGIAPNFVHSLDSSHLVVTVHKCLEHGMDAFAMVHDDYGVHAGNVDTLHKYIREAFVELYTDQRYLQELNETCSMALGIQETELPPVGDFDIRTVNKSKYFFS